IGAGYFSIDKLESEIKAVKEKSSQPFGVNLFVPNQNATVNPLQVDQMNEWLKPYRRAFHLEEPVVNIDETQKFNEAVNMIIKYKV
ncbi:nitronate monooxygenase, partial [Staphylococcus ureilyticus]